jgi:hypothetical protein
MPPLTAAVSPCTYDLSAFADESRVLTNPHKGWYHHYYDNDVAKYGVRLERGDRLLDFPGLATLYLRLPWCELEPEEGRFAWQILDRVIDEWLPTGRTFAFCVSCKETNPKYVFATPEWVRAAGARGDFIARADGSPGNWEPDYGDPVFLEKLEAFHTAFAARYDGKPWVEWVTIGSYGDWGEGHTCSSSRREWPVAVLKKHIDLYRRLYRHSRLEANDDLVGSRTDRVGAEELRRHIDGCGLSLTDHGISVDWFAKHYGPSTLRDAAWLRRSAERTPVVLELEHYHLTVKHGNWKAGEPLRLAIEETAATFAGFHGCARTWLADNAPLGRRLANRLGYWIFLRALSLPLHARRGGSVEFALTWENRGVAPLYFPADLRLRLEPVHAGVPFVLPVATVAGSETVPGESRTLFANLALPQELPAGEYLISLSLVDRRLGRPLQFACRETAVTQDGYHLLPDARLRITA